MKEKFSEAQKIRRIDHFRRIIFYRSVFGWVFSSVGLSLFVVGLKKINNPLILINGILFFVYGLFMVWQTHKAKKKNRC